MNHFNIFKIPKSGFINAIDFETPKHLADYLVYLDNNREAYNAYFEWKQNVIFNKPLKYTNLCNMCIHLHLEEFYGLKRQILTDLDNYWNRDLNCAMN